ncbi:hypothetical protein ACSLO2_27405, partial [Escherichia coli]|uniref:hypothetical protein n=1 Tax=Escherichia coli TaxID=562 RepID=UPI003EE357E0
ITILTFFESLPGCCYAISNCHIHINIQTFFECVDINMLTNQLRTKTWPEIIKWSNLAITKDWFTCTATAMYSNDPGHDKRWR